MEINLIRLVNKELSSLVKEEDENLIHELNDLLFDDDYVIKEGVKEAVIDLLFVESDNIASLFKKVESRLKDTVLILAGKDLTALKSALEINTYLGNKVYHYHLTNDNIEESATIIKEFAAVALARTRFKNANIAIIGEFHNDDIINKIDTTFFNEYFHLNVIKINEEELANAFNKAKMDHIYHQNIIDALMKDNKKDHTTFIKLYNAVQMLIDKYNLSGFCFNVPKYDDFDYPLAALFNERGYSVILESDLYSLTSLLILNETNDATSLYGTISRIDLAESNLYLLVNMAPFNMMNSNGGVNSGSVTVFKICYDNKRFLALNGKISDSYEKEGQIEVVINLDNTEIFDLFRLPIGGSLALSYGDSVARVYALDSLLHNDQ